MTNETIGHRVKDIVAEQLGLQIEDITLGLSFTGDLGADDLDFVEIVMAFEEEFDVEISDEEAWRFGTVKDAVNFIASRMN